MAEGKSEYTAILNKYKNNLDGLIDSSNTVFSDQPESSDQPELIDKGTRIARKFTGTLSTLFKEDFLNKNVLLKFLGLTPKI